MADTIYFFNGRNDDIDRYYFDKEYRDDIIVEISGVFYELYFFTKDSLEYEMTKEGYFSLPGLIILDKINTNTILTAIRKLKNIKYFTRLQGYDELSQEKRFIHNWYVNELPQFDIKNLVCEDL